MRRAVLLIVSFCAFVVRVAMAQEIEVDLELVLAVDVSGSVDTVEAAQQREGYVSALVDPAVIRAIEATYTGKVAMTYVEWAGDEFQQVMVPWTIVDGMAAARAFAAAVAEAPSRRAMWTSISGVIDFSAPLFDGNGINGVRRVIDVSGDGSNNRGRPVGLARDAAVAQGITINGLPILNDRPQPMGLPTPMEMALDRYYRENVIGGPGSFLVPALGFEEFRDAILRKLILEIAGATPAGQTAGMDPSAALGVPSPYDRSE